MGILLVSSFESFIQLIGVLLVFVFVLAITYATTRWIGGYQKTRYLNKNLKVIESIPMGNNKSLCLVQAGERFLVVGVGKDEIRLLTTLEEENLVVHDMSGEKEGIINTETFQETLDKWKKKLQKK